MRELEQLQQYELILTVRSPLFVGSGQSYQRTEYIYDRRSNRISVLHRNRFICFLTENDLADSYEQFILSGSTNLHSFLRQECGLDEAGIRDLCVYDLPAGDALDAEHSLKDIQTFMRDSAFRPYVPGSSVKGALRTVLLYQSMQERGILGSKNWRDYSKTEGIPEREYLNTLHFVNDSKGKTRLDAVSSLLRGVLVSDSEPISNNAMTLTGKRDVTFNGEINAINLCREAVAPGTRIRFSLTLDQSVLHGKLTAESIMDAIEKFDQYYEESYASGFAQPEKAALGRMNHCLILGGGAGFFSKSLAYPYYGEKQALYEVSEYMNHSFQGHGHQYDEKWGMSPHMMKYTQWNGKMYPYGICEVSMR